MTKPADIAHNPFLDGLPPYNAGMNLAKARQASGRNDVAALASNENPYGCSPAVAQRLAKLEPWRYSDSNSTALRQALAAHLGAAADTIVVGNGSEELIALLARVYLAPGDTVLTVAPAFGLHEIQPRAMGAKVVKVPMTAQGGFDVARLVAELGKKPKLFFLSSPWNPVGAGLTRDELSQLVAACSPETIFVYDEAYFEFRDAQAPDGLEVLRASHIPWVVLRTFSKAYGLAGLRVGYGLVRDAAMAQLINVLRTPFNVNAASQAAALAALEDQSWMKAHAALIVQQRDALRAGLQALGLQVAPSQANFLFINLGLPAKAVATALLKEGIVSKAWTEPGYETFLRLSIGLPEENARVLAVFKRLLA